MEKGGSENFPTKASEFATVFLRGEDLVTQKGGLYVAFAAALGHWSFAKFGFEPHNLWLLTGTLLALLSS